MQFPDIGAGRQTADVRNTVVFKIDTPDFSKRRTYGNIGNRIVPGGQQIHGNTAVQRGEVGDLIVAYHQRLQLGHTRKCRNVIYLIGTDVEPFQCGHVGERGDIRNTVVLKIQKCDLFQIPKR